MRRSSSQAKLNIVLLLGVVWRTSEHVVINLALNEMKFDFEVMVAKTWLVELKVHHDGVKPTTYVESRSVVGSVRWRLIST